MPKISIIVPVYKVEEYLERCIDSILNQTFKNFELILVDDGSPDNCGKICDEYALKDSRIKVIHKENGGQSSARNAGLDIAQGEYIGFVDSDDWIEPDMYEILYKMINSSEKDIANIGLSFVDEQSQNKQVFSKHSEIILNKEEAILELVKQNLFGNYFWANLYKKELFKHLRFREGIKFEDIDLMYQIFSDANGVISKSDSKYNYLQRTNGTVSSYKDYGLIELQDINYRKLVFIKKFYKYMYIKNLKYFYNKTMFYLFYDKIIELIYNKDIQDREKKIEKILFIFNDLFVETLIVKVEIKVKINLLLLLLTFKLSQKGKK